jgi:hypothetical protein|nr:hypothetical protein [uncultured Acetatifactor sp.]
MNRQHKHIIPALYGGNGFMLQRALFPLKRERVFSYPLCMNPFCLKQSGMLHTANLFQGILQT